MNDDDFRAEDPRGRCSLVGHQWAVVAVSASFLATRAQILMAALIQTT